MKNIFIKKVKTKKDLKEFILFPWKIYKNNSNWVPPLIRDVKEKMNKKRNPFFEHAEMDLFLAHKDGEITGRIAAILDENHNKFHNEKIVFFGLFESINDPATAMSLLDKVSDWGRERGMETVRGPMNLSMNDECAFLCEGFDSPPYIMMTYNPPYYLELMEKYGMVKAKDLYAYYMTKDHQTTEKVKGIVDQITKVSPLTLRTLDMKNLDQDIEKVKYIYNEAWEKNWGFVPWTDAEMDYMAQKLKQFADPSIVILAEDKGKPVGFAFGFPNYNEILQKMNGRLFPTGFIKFLLNRNKIKSMRALVFGILGEYRQTGTSYLLYSEMERNGVASGYEECEMSWQLEDNEPVNRFVASIGGKIYKKYRIYEKKIV